MRNNKKSTTPLTPETCALLYDRAVEYIGKGGYNRAGKLLRQVRATQPEFRDAAALIRICDEGKRAQTFVQWTASIFALLVFCATWLLFRRTDIWMLAISALALLIGVAVSQQIYARFLAPKPHSRDESALGGE